MAAPTEQICSPCWHLLVSPWCAAHTGFLHVRPCSAACHQLHQVLGKVGFWQPRAAWLVAPFSTCKCIAYGTGVAKVFVPVQVLLRKDIEQLMNSKAQKVN